MTDPGVPPSEPEAPPAARVVKEREAGFSDAVILLLVFLGCQLVLGLGAAFAAGIARGKMNSLFVACVEAGSLAALIPVIRMRLGHWLTDYVRYAPVPAGAWAAIPVCCAGLLFGLRQLEGVVVHLIPITGLWRAVFGQLTGAGAFARGLLVAAVVAPIVEEIIFRGIILRGFAEKYGKNRALLYSSLLFGIVHLNPWQFIPAVALGLFLGALYLRTGTVVTTCIAHAFYNGAILVLSRFPSTRALVDAEVSGGLSQAVFGALTAAGLVVFCLGFWLLLRSSRPAAAGS
jgi:membrane protease YdiL (CAAX protease family)